MRAIDVDRRIAMNEIKVRARALLIMADEYEKIYKDNSDSASIQMDNLNDVWRIISENTDVLVNTVKKES